MGRKVRMVPANWQHPQDSNGRAIPLFDGAQLAERLAEWDTQAAQWEKGLRDDYCGSWQPLEQDEVGISYTDWAGPRPDPADYTPAWTPEEATHLMMYEDTSEGTPISPAFATAEGLAQWLSENEASYFGKLTTSYDHWLGIIKGTQWGGGIIVRVVILPPFGAVFVVQSNNKPICLYGSGLNL